MATRQLILITTEILMRLALLVGSGIIKVQIGKVLFLEIIVLSHGRTPMRLTPA